jgi:hypothetical protein
MTSPWVHHRFTTRVPKWSVTSIRDDNLTDRHISITLDLNRHRWLHSMMICRKVMDKPSCIRVFLIVRGERERERRCSFDFSFLSSKLWDLLELACNRTWWSNQMINFVIHLFFSPKSNFSLFLVIFGALSFLVTFGTALIWVLELRGDDSWGLWTWVHDGLDLSTYSPMICYQNPTFLCL